MPRRIIAVTRHMPGVVETLSKYGEVRSAPPGAELDKAGLIALMSDADAVLTAAWDSIDAEVISACPKLRLICNTGVGYNNIDIVAARLRKIMVTNTPGVTDDAVADLAMGLMIALARRLPQADVFVRSGQWTKATLTSFGLGQDVSRKTLGIIGFGRIGQTLAKRAQGFDMTVLYHARCPVSAETESLYKARHCTLDKLLADSDFVVLLVPYSTATHHIIGAEQLKKMKPSAFLLNIARGGVVDDEALAVALKSGALAGAALDCVENEPNIHPELLELPNVIFSPHIGSATPGTRQALVSMSTQNLIAGITGQTPPNLIPLPD
ncbi:MULTISPECIES: 2-hydroxyacid dehydrogenase [Pseudomonas]|uniref:D-glycerate dehydrogenase n=3 Tax=Pseudomonas TaxID=286 RepID=A0A6G6ISK8_PSENT|nr:D-glycerate dehydrogenase [Pseudomonas nitroreducens]NWE87088.1 D-glycerate dehydrogenase [Pseudomonas reactans]QIE86098.1 D-glycerate dehydrogenase [Pseudomonas nitroreducens]HCE6398422.1 D-glycerate dehydrogenase [Pseudomonas aeruginosa]